MAYKFQRGAATASGSFTAEEGLTSNTSVSAVGGNLSGSAQLLVGTSATIGNGLVVSLGGAQVTGALNVNGYVSGSGILQIGGGADFGNNVAVKGGGVSGSGAFQGGSTATFANTLTVTAGGAQVTGALNVNNFVSASSGILGGGSSTLNDLTINGNLTVLGTTISASVQNLIIEDKQIVLADGAANAAAAEGAGFFVSGANVQLVYKQQGAGAASTSGDIFQFSGSSAFTSVQAKTFYGEFVGSNVNSVTIIGDANQNPLSTGVNFANVNFSTTRTWTLPNLPATGSSVIIKGPGNLSSTTALSVSAPAPYSIDGETSVVLESGYAAIECIFVSGTSWMII